jgi:hypothetical protein
MDPALKALLESTSDAQPLLRVVAGAGVFVGRPCPLDEYLRLAEWGVYTEAYETTRPRRKEREAAETNAKAVAHEVAVTMQSGLRAGDAHENVVTLREVEMYPLGGGEGLAIPAVRIPASAVTAWWIGPAKVQKGEGGGGWVAGGAVWTE